MNKKINFSQLISKRDTSSENNSGDARFVFEELEPRLLLSADALAVITESSVTAFNDLSSEDHSQSFIHQELSESASHHLSDDINKTTNQVTARAELVIIDPRAPNFQQLHNDVIKAQQQGRNINVVILDAHRDGIQQISDAISQYKKLDAVHIVSHGKDAQLELGATQLNKQNLKQRSEEIAQWKDVFTDGGDVLIYGCNLAESSDGTALVNSLSKITGADVAASDDLTGNSILGGDWDLEYKTGEIESSLAFSTDVQESWQGTLNAEAQAASQEQVQAAEQEEAHAQEIEQQAELDAALLAEEEQEESIALQQAEQQSSEVQEQRQEIVFIDESVSDYQSFIDDLQNSSDSSVAFEIIKLNSSTDGIEQISNVLSAYDDVDAVHIFSHGSDGAVKLGNTWLNANNLADYDESLTIWSNALDENADILIYGCNLAESESGEQFVDQLASLTSADVAASDDLTGSTSLGGDWDLEYKTGEVEAAIAPSEEVQQNWGSVLAVSSSYSQQIQGGGLAIDTVGMRTDDIFSGDNTPTLNIASIPAGATVVDAFLYVNQLDKGISDTTFTLNGSSITATEIANSTSPDWSGVTRASTVKVDVSSIVTGNGSFTLGGASSASVLYQGASLVVVYEDTSVFTESIIALHDGSETQRDFPTVDDLNVNLLLNNGSVLPTNHTNASATIVAFDSQNNFSENNLTFQAGSAGSATVIKSGGTFNGDSGGAEQIDVDITSLITQADTNATLFQQASNDHLVYAVVGTVIELQNVAPVNSVPGAQITNEDTALVFNSANSNLITVGDTDAGSHPVEVTLAVTNGTLTLSGTSGLTLTTGDGTADASITFSGTVTDINNALDGLSYTPNGNYNGADTLTLSTLDSELTSITIDANLLGHYSFDDTAALGNDDSPAGANDATINGATATVDGTRGDVLNFDGNDYVEITGHFGDPANLTLAAWVNPSAYGTNGTDFISLGDSVVLRYEAFSSLLTGFYYDGSSWNEIQFSTDLLSPDSWSHVAYSVDDTNNLHTLYLDGVAVASATMTGSVSYTLGANSYIGAHGELATQWYAIGEIDDARVYDRALTAAEIATLADDLNLQDTDTVAITVNAVNDAPTATNLSAAESYTEDTALNLIDIVVSDVDSANTTVTLTLSDVSAGSLSTATSGAVTSTFVGGVWTASGAIADVNVLLAGVTFNPTLNYNSNFSIATSVDDGVAPAVTGSKVMTGTPVNDAPVIITNNPLNVPEEATVTITTAFLEATDVDNTATQIVFTLTSLPSGGSVRLSGSTLGLGGTFTQDDINNNLVTYRDNDEGATTSFQVTVSDGTTTLPAITFSLNGAPINDAPVNTTPVSVTTTEEVATAIAGISIIDIDANGGNLTTQLQVNNGVLNITLAGSATISAGVNGSNDLTILGTVADINATLTSLTYTGNTDVTGINADTLTMTTNDLGNTGSGGALQDVDTVQIDINNVNDAPTATNLSAVESYTEDTAINLIDIVVSDVDSANTTVTLTLSDIAAGDLSTATSGLVTSTFAAGVWTASGAIADVNTLLANVTFNPALNYDSNFSVTTSIDDGVAPAVTGAKMFIASAVNDAPVNTVPAAQITDIDTALAFTVGGGNGIQVSDVDAPTLEITLGAINGTLTLNGVVGLSFTSGTGTNDANMIFTGSITDINNALDGLTFNPDTGYGGTASITLKSDDLGGSGSGGVLTDSDIVSITVGNSTTLFQNGVSGYTGTEDTELTESLPATDQGNNTTISVDLDNGGGESQGLIRFDSIFGSGPGQIPLGSTIDSASLTINVFDESDSSTTIALHRVLTGWNESSTWNSLTNGIQLDNTEASSIVDSTMTVAEFTGPQTFYGLEAALQSWSDGGINLGWAIVTDSNDGWDFYSSEHGIISERPQLTISFTPPQPSAIDLDANNDSGATGADYITSFTEDGGAVLIADTDALLTDVDSSILQSLTVTLTSRPDGIAETLSANAGATGIVVNYNSGTGVLTLTGNNTVANYEQVLKTVAYNNASQNPDVTVRTVTVVALDDTGLSSNTATATININALNDAPTATNLNAAESYTEDTPLNLTDIVVSDVDNANTTVTLTLSDIAAGSLSTATSGLVTSTFVGGVWTASGAVADVNVLLAAVTFTPTLNYNSSFNITTSVDDGIAPAVTGSKLFIATAVNDAPVLDLNGAPAGIDYTTTFVEGGGAVDITSASVSLIDVDNASLNSIIVHLTNRLDPASKESLSANTGATALSAVWNSTSDTLTISGAGTVADYLSVLATVQYDNTANNPDSTTRIITFVANDGTDNSVLATTTLNFTAVNNAPTATSLSAAESYTEDTPINLIDIVVTDVDSVNTTVTLTLSDIAAGSLSTASSGAVTSTFIGGVWTASGAIADVNTLLAGVTFNPALNYNSNFNITTSVDDGISPAVTGSKAFTATAVNDAPTATNLNAAESYTEDTPLNLTDIVVTDIDNANTTVTLTLSDVAAGSLSTATSGSVTSTFVGGVWTASGVIADVNILLAGVTFNPALNYDSNFTIATSVDDGIAPAVTGTKVITGNAVNDAPTATNLNAAESYTEDTALNLTDIVVTDVDNSNTTVTLTLSDVGAGTLSTGTAGLVTSTFVGGVWTASGAIADVNALLAGVTFNPTLNYDSNFSIATSVDDGVAAAITGTKVMTSIPVNDAPVNIINSTTLFYSAATGTIPIDPLLTVTDVDSANLTSATIRIATGYISAEDRIRFTDQLGISGSFNATTGVMTLTGTASVANYQTALRSIAYENTNFTPTQGTFTVDFSVSDGSLTSIIDTRTVTVVPNAPPNALDDTAIVDEGNTVIINLVGNDTDAEGVLDLASIVIVSPASNGSLVVNGNGTVTYTHDGSETISDTFTYTIADAPGFVSSVATVNITINPINDAPTATNLNAAESYTEDTPLNLTDIVVSDVDNTNTTVTLTLSDVGAGTLSTATSGLVTSTFVGGVWTASGAVADVNVLLAGVTFNPALNYNANFNIATSVDDGVAPAVTGTKLFTATPVNDPAIIGGVDTGVVTEDVDPDVDTLLETAGALTISDVDTGEASFTAGTLIGTYGDITIDAAGNWSYAADNTQAAIQNLAAGASLIDTISITSFDGTTHNIVITINGANDAAVIGGVDTGVVTEDVDPDVDTLLETAGTLTVSDIDTGEASFTAGTLIGTYGDITIDAAGNWTYAADNTQAVIQNLAAGASLIDTISITSFDGTSHNIVITINGANDAAVIGGVDTGIVTEDVDPDLDTLLETAGALTITDTDTGEASFTAGTLIGTYGDITIDAAGNWTYAADNTQAAIQNLAAGASLIDTISITSFDGTSHNIVITINGANDAAVIGGVDTGIVTEDVDPDVDTLLETAGTLTITDTDTGEASFTAGTLIGTYGDITIDAAGNWSYTADNTQAVIQNLAAGASLTDTISVTSFDGTTHNIVITINGANDAAVIGGVDTGAVTEDVDPDLDALLETAGALTITDTDTGEASFTAGTLIGTYGDITIDAAGNWSYAADNTQAAIQNLAAGASLTDTISITSFDGTTHNIVITINGANDAAVIGGVDTGIVTEDVDPDLDTLLETAGTLTIADADTGEASFTAGTLAGTYGALVIDAAGNWSYAADNTQLDIQSLTTGDLLIDTIAVTSFDGTSHNIVITISGTNDAPVAQNDNAPGIPTINEGASAILDLSANDSDIDNAIDLSSIVITTPPLNGSLVINGDGTVTYTHDGSETISDSFSYTVADISGAVSNVAIASLIINPVNDAPVAQNDNALTVDEGATANFDLAANDSDADDGLDLNSINIISAPINGSLIVNSDGTVTYTHDSSETLTDSFTYTIADVSGVISNIATANIVINPVNDSPTTVGITNVTVLEDAPNTSIDLNLAFNDSDNPDSELTYSIVGNTNIGLFSNADIDGSTGLLSLAYSSDQNGSSQMTIRATDIAGESVDTLFTVNVTPVNDDSVVDVNTGALITDVSEKIIDTSMLNSFDIDNSLSEITYIITHLPDDGVLLLNGVVLVTNDSFTQADLVNGNVSYQLGFAPSGDDHFGFTVTDGSSTLSPMTFNIVISLTPVDPVDPGEPEEPEPETPDPVDPEEVDPVKSINIPDVGVPSTATFDSIVLEQLVQKLTTGAEKAKNTEINETIDSNQLGNFEVENYDLKSASSLEDIQIKSIKGLWLALDKMQEEINEHVTENMTNAELKAAAVSSSGVALTAGVVAWVLRSGALMTSLISTIPLWKGYDPMPILSKKLEEEDEDEDELVPSSLEELKKQKALKEKMNMRNKVDTFFGGTEARE